MDKKIGLELELNLIDKEGNLSNKADEILLDPRNNSDIIGELSQSMIEVIGPPSDKIYKVGSDFAQNLLLLDTIAKDFGLMLVPSTTVGKDAYPVSNDSRRIRGMRKRKVLGNRLRDLEHHICGTHVHIDHLSSQEKTYKQYLVMQAMDPLFTLMSSTPFFLGNNTKKDYRVDIYRNVVFKDFPLQGQLVDYPSSIEDILKRRQEGFDHWLSMDKYDGTDGFKPEDTCWGPIRLCKKTVESRCADANLLSHVLGFAALYQAASHYVDEEDPTIVIDRNAAVSQKGYFTPKGRKVVIPGYQFLKQCESEGISDGLDSEIVYPYVKNIVRLIQPYIKKEDIIYIEPILDLLEKRKTFSDEIISYARDEGLEKDHMLKDSAARDVRQYIATRYDSDLRSTAKKMGF